MPIENDNGAVLAGYTTEIHGTGKIILPQTETKRQKLYLLVKPDTDLKTQFTAYDMDGHELVAVRDFAADNGEPLQMYCFSCEKVMTFTPTPDVEDGFVCECGYLQDSEAQAAAEVCGAATWHDLDAYKKTTDYIAHGKVYVRD